MKAKVWDLAVRGLHWGLGITMVVAWAAGEASLQLHQVAGYCSLAIVVARCLWGAAGTRHARFSRFVKSPATVWRYVLDVAHRREPRHVGHNPLGGWMVCALLGLTGAVGVTGWMYTLDRFWGMAWLEWLHHSLAWVLLGFIGLHLAGVMFTSWRHQENLVVAMVSGRKRPAQGQDVE